MKTVASVSMILFFATVMTMVSDNADSTNWMSRLAELSVGFALGLHLPSQQLMIAETAIPYQRYNKGELFIPLLFLSHKKFHFRATLATLSYVILAFGTLLAHLLSLVVPWVSGLCVLNVAILSTHFIAVGFFHPETPRFLFAIKDRKADCANSLQWLRGKMEDIGQEYTELADAVMLSGGTAKIPIVNLIEDRSVFSLSKPRC